MAAVTTKLAQALLSKSAMTRAQRVLRDMVSDGAHEEASSLAQQMAERGVPARRFLNTIGAGEEGVAELVATPRGIAVDKTYYPGNPHATRSQLESRADVWDILHQEAPDLLPALRGTATVGRANPAVRHTLDYVPGRPGDLASDADWEAMDKVRARLGQLAPPTIEVGDVHPGNAIFDEQGNPKLVDAFLQSVFEEPAWGTKGHPNIADRTGNRGDAMRAYIHRGADPEGFLDPKTAAFEYGTKDKDIELWEAYTQAPSPMTLEPLMKQLDPLIQAEVNRWAGALARPVLEAKAKALALEAIKNYNPHAGAALGTHVVNRLKKLSRSVYTHQDAVRIPEYKKLKIHSYMRGQSELMDVHGREPTNEELADHLGWSPKALSDVQRTMRPELIQSEDVGGGLFERQSVWGSDSNDGMIDMVYYDLDPTDKLIFEHSTGYSGKPVLSNTELMQRTGLTQGQLSYRKRKIIDKIKLLAP